MGHGADPCPTSGTDPGNRGKRPGFAVELFLTRTKIPIEEDGGGGGGVDVYKVYDFFVMISSFETIAGAPED